MSDSAPMSEGPGAGAAPASAGAMLRQARQAQGMHIAALAAAIKVTPRKLEMLESDQFDQLPDATFTRALAQTVCRALKIDPAPVLALLPHARGQRLEEVGTGLNAPFRDRPGMTQKDGGLLGSPVFWLTALIVLAALAVYLLPAHWLERQGFGNLRLGSSASAASPAGEPASATVTESVAAGSAGDSAGAASAAAASTTSGAFPPPGAATEAPADTAPSDTQAAKGAGSDAGVAAAAPVASSATPGPNPATVNGPLQVRPSAQSWVQVTDAKGATLVSRLVEAGETVGLDGTPPFKLTIGNAGATQVVYRGRTVELAPYIRDNVARFELK